MTVVITLEFTYFYKMQFLNKFIHYFWVYSTYFYSFCLIRPNLLKSGNFHESVYTY